MPKPSEFYVGVLDFFAILLPGAIATAILSQRFGHLVIGKLIAAPDGDAARWGIFLTFAYFIGHLIFLAGSYVDTLYNTLRERFNPYGNESAFQCAKRIRDSFIEENERSALNPRAVLLSTSPAAAEDVHRLEADSKFFRSLLVVCLLSSLVFTANGDYAEALVALALVVPCFARYYERRLKSTTQAYMHVVTLHRLGKLGGGEARG